MEENQEFEEQTPADPSHELDLETVFEAVGTEAEIAAMAVQSMLDANGIPAVLIGTSTMPNLPFEVRVPHDHIEEARRQIAEAEAAGPAAAEEAERATET
ncbi:MAG: DUF2007 domain-containing protein [Acidobacteria bacterium]|nr:DUF2007 domain-containing protein [Acidobacteriota bacterium]